ncbi:MAG TPA: PEPxxWA-CTERM sorting domain-containing protein [Sphingobium sp.]|nr:PEPxxWA-CTERM sorting domain-containing protein [Sphingobium sp.]
MKRIKTVAAALAVTGALVTFPANAAVNFSFENLTGAEYDTAGVYVTGDIVFDGTVDDGAGFDDVLFQLWDDSDLKFEQTYSGLLGVTNTFHFEAWYPGLVGTSAPGVGLYLYDDGVEVLSIDPFFPPHYADPSECQENCGPVGEVPEPSTWLMLVAGFGLLGGALRARRAQTAVSFS